VLPSGREVTLYRSTKGGGMKLHDGLVTAAEKDAGTILATAEGKKDEAVSHFLLNEIGLANKQIVRNANADSHPRYILRHHQGEAYLKRSYRPPHGT
jgi:hypothetical protein